MVIDSETGPDPGRGAPPPVGRAAFHDAFRYAQIALDAVRIHGGYGYSTPVRSWPLLPRGPPMIVGEGTNEIQRSV